MQRSSGMSRLLIIGLVVLVVLFLLARCAMGGLGGLLGGGGGDIVDTRGNAPADTTFDSGVRLGNVVTAQGVDRDGCPTDVTGSFRSDDTIYVVAERSVIPAGTTVFARLYRDGQPVEDTNEITADRDMDACVWFQFEDAAAAGFEPGSYEAELLVNGNPSDAASFTVN